MFFGKERRPFVVSARRRRLGLEVLEDRLAPAVTIQFDYSHDSSGFFAANPQAKTVLNAAAQVLGTALDNSLPAIAPAGRNSWSAVFFNPSDPYGANLTVPNLSVPANTLVVFAGATDLSQSGQGYLGTAAPGGYRAMGSNAWLNLVAGRGQAGALTARPTGFGTWGGSLTFDDGTDWSFSGTPGAGQEDFFTVALYELGSVLGIGTADSWFTHVNAANHTFTGPHAEATPIQVGGIAQTGPVPLDPGGAEGDTTPNDYWAGGLLSAGQAPLMDIYMGDGQTHTLTPLDWAGLADIGWNVDHLAVTTPPATSVTVGGGFRLAVAAEDPDGSVDTLFNGKVTLKFGSNPGGGKLAGTLTATAVHGVATFSGLTINQIAAGYTLQASSPGLPGAATGPFNVIPAGKATQLVLQTQPASIRAGNSFTLVVAAEDGLGNLDPTFAGSVTLALASGLGTLGGTLSVVAVHGVATFPGLTIDRAGAGYAVQASAPGFAPANSTAVSVSAGLATHLVITAQPPASVLVGDGFAFTIAAEDAFGNVDPTFNGSVTAALNSNPGTGTLGGNTTVVANNGVAVFTGLTLSAAGSGYTLRATGGGMSVVSSAVSAAMSLAPSITIDFDYSEDSTGFFASHPQAKTVLQEAGQIIGSELHDSLAAITPSAGNSWIASFLNPGNPSASYLQWMNLAVPANTLIVFVGGADLEAGNPGQVSTDGWSASGSKAWLDLVGGRGQAGALTTPATDFGPWGGAISFNNNLDWSFAGTGGAPGSGQVDFLTVALQQLGEVLGVGSSPAWAHDLGSTGTTFIGAHARASYGGPVPTTGIAWALGLQSAGQEPLFDMTILPGQRRQLTPLDLAGLADIGWTVDRLAVTTQPAAAVTAGSAFSVVVSVEAPDGSVDAGFTGPVTISLGNNPGNAVLGGTLTVHAVHGVVTFSGLTLSRTGAGYTLLASLPNGSSLATTTTPFAVAAASATHLVILSQPAGGLTLASLFGLVVKVEDRFGNLDTTFNGPVTVMLENKPAGTVLSGTLTVQAVGGIATFTDLDLNHAAKGFRLKVSANGLTAVTTGAFNITV